jgi:DUF4097 and DUF4098 domain-containing protein YvlB
MDTNFVFTCENLRPWPGARPASCETRDLRVAYTGEPFKIIGGGAVRLRGWQGDTIAVRARIEVYSENGDPLPTAPVAVELTSTQVQATGPALEGNAWWQTSFEVFIPMQATVNLEVKNGLVDLADLSGAITMNINNGAIVIKRCDGAIKGSTRNGAIAFENSPAPGQSIDLHTGNGEVRFSYLQGVNGEPHFTGAFELKYNWGKADISPEFVQLPAVSVTERNKTRLTGRIGGADGPGRIALSTNNGNVIVRIAR